MKFVNKKQIKNINIKDKNNITKNYFKNENKNTLKEQIEAKKEFNKMIEKIEYPISNFFN